MNRNTATDVLADLGWSSLGPDQIICSGHPKSGGIIDKAIAADEWFVIFNDDTLPLLDGYETREDAAQAALALIAPEPEQDRFCEMISTP